MHKTVRWLLSLLVLLCVIPAGRGAASVAPIRVYIFAGQSNMVGKATTSSQLAAIDPALSQPQDDALFYGPLAEMPHRWAPLKPPTNLAMSEFRLGFGPEVSGAPRLAALHPGEKVAILKLAWNGTSLADDWNPNGCCIYRQAVVRAHRALEQLSVAQHRPVAVAGWFWMQGEWDAMTYARASAYAANLDRFIGRVRAEFSSPKMPFVIGRIADLRRDFPDSFRYSSIVRAQQAQVAADVPLTYLISTDDLEHADDRLHYSSAGTVALGRRFVQTRFGL